MTSGVSKAIVSILESYPDSHSIVQWTWYAVASLAQSKDIGYQLAQLGICKTIGDMLSKYQTEEDIVQWIALAVSELSIDPILNRNLCNEGLPSLLVEVFFVPQLNIIMIVFFLLYCRR